MLELNKIYCGDCLEVFKAFPDESINCVVTSPPYWALRDYGVAGQLGLEPTFQEYITKLCDIFDEVKRVLKKDGTCWVNMGDTYNAGGNYRGKEMDETCKEVYSRKDFAGCQNDKKAQGIQDKCLCQIPSRFAIEMTNRGWILRNEIIWYKPNAMPSSVTDRFTVDFEKVFFFVKNKKYWFEQQLEKSIWAEKDKRSLIKGGVMSGGKTAIGGYATDRVAYTEGGMKNKRAVWTISTHGFKEAHFATYPETLIEPMIKAGCPIGGIVLDPFMGAGTTGVVSKKQDKNYVGIELNPEYCKIAEERIKNIPTKLL
jgi:DNA modification methylase